MEQTAYIEMDATEANHWWFRGRRAILQHYLQTMQLPTTARILEIGAGTGGNLSLLQRHGKVTAVEMDPAARAMALRKTDGNVTILAGRYPDDLPINDARFDLVCMFDVLEHIEDDDAALHALHHLLLPGGRVLLTVPAYPWMWSSHDTSLHHKRRYQRSALAKKIQAAGLCIHRLTHFNTLLFPLAALARLKDKATNSQTASGTGIPPQPVNEMFRILFSAERHLLQHIDLPFGLSLLAVITSR